LGLQVARLLVIKSAVSEGMKARRISKNVLAKKMGTSRSVVYRLLDPADTSVTLDTIVRAETALDRKFFFAKRRAPRRKVRGK
jgi:antitoxin HicB